MQKGIVIAGILFAIFFIVGFVYADSPNNTNRVIGQIINNSGTTAITKDVSRVAEDSRHFGTIVCGLQGELTKTTTIYYFGYMDSYAIHSDGSNSFYTLNNMQGSISLYGISGVEDNYSVGMSSPSIFVITVAPGATIKYVISGIIYRDGR